MKEIVNKSILMFIKEIFLASKIVAPRTIGIANKN